MTTVIRNYHIGVAANYYNLILEKHYLEPKENVIFILLMFHSIKFNEETGWGRNTVV